MFLAEKWHEGVNYYGDLLHELLTSDKKTFTLKQLDQLLDSHSSELRGITRAVNRIAKLNLTEKELILHAYTFNDIGFPSRKDIYTSVRNAQKAIMAQLHGYMEWLYTPYHTTGDIIKFQQKLPQLLKESELISCHKHKAFICLKEAVVTEARTFGYV